MNIKYLAVDSNVQLANSEAVVWLQQGIEMERADNMREAIQKLSINDEYLYVGINSDAVDFIQSLSLMRSFTNVPILIVTGRFTTEAEVNALNNGADLFARWHKTTEGNIDSVMAHVKRKTERDKTQCQPSNIVSYGGLIITSSSRRVFIGGTLIDLTYHEYELLNYFIKNCDKALSYGQIYRHVWGSDYEDSARNVLWSAVKRLREKLKINPDGAEHIEAVRDYGYRFPSNNNIK